MIMQTLKIIFLASFLGAIVACSTMKSGDDDSDKKKNKVAEINIQLGLAYLEKGNMQRAKQKLLYAAEKAPNLPEAWYSLAYYSEMTGNKKEAEQNYTKAIQLAPQRGDVLNNYGTFLCRSGYYKKAIHYFLLASQDTHYLDTASAYENAGLCALKIPDRKQAIAYFSRALEEDPAHTVSIAELNKLGKKV